MVESEAKDPHWAESARGLLAALIMWEVMQAQRAQRWPSLFNVRTMLTEPDGKNPDGQIISGFTLTIRRMVERGGDKITSLVGRFMREGGRNELASIQSTAITQTEWLLSSPMRANEISRMRRWTRTVIVSALRELFRPSPLKTLFVLHEY
jgi:type IV secretion system protein VirD4